MTDRKYPDARHVKDWNVSIETRCQGTDPDLKDPYKAITYPLYQTATFSHASFGESTGFDYTRQTNPTRQELETVVARLENGSDAIAFSSGMAAITTVMEMFRPGDHILCDADLYGGSIRLFRAVNEKNGLEFSDIDMSSEDPEPLIRENTKAIYLETPTNPMMNVTDLEKLSALAKDRGILLIVDNTFLSPYFQNPLDHGADIVVHSGTKYLGGHHDVIGGFLVVRSDELSDRIRFLLKTTGSALSPFDSWLLLRGIRTLAVRMERAQENCFKIAEFLKNSKHVTKVLYPGLPEHPGHEIMKKQARGFGSMITFEVESKEFAHSILNNVELFYFAESLGGTETLITYPITQTHADVPKEQLDENGITDCLLRLSVGIEGADDLIAEFERVFAIAEKESADI